MEFMDLLFSRYASPLDFVKLYINQGRFGEFVEGIISLENKRKKEQQEKEDDDKLWQAYIRSMSEKSFIEWKQELKQGNEQSNKQPETLSMTNERVADVKEQARGILKGFSPV